MMAIILEMRGITKEFPGVKALDDVSLRWPKARYTPSGRRERRRQVDPDEGLSGVYPGGSYDRRNPL